MAVRSEGRIAGHSTRPTPIRSDLARPGTHNGAVLRWFFGAISLISAAKTGKSTRFTRFTSKIGGISWPIGSMLMVDSCGSKTGVLVEGKCGSIYGIHGSSGLGYLRWRSWNVTRNCVIEHGTKMPKLSGGFKEKIDWELSMPLPRWDVWYWPRIADSNLANGLNGCWLRQSTQFRDSNGSLWFRCELLLNDDECIDSWNQSLL